MGKNTQLLKRKKNLNLIILSLAFQAGEELKVKIITTDVADKEANIIPKKLEVKREKSYSQKELNEIWEEAVEILKEKHKEHDSFSRIYDSSFLYQETKTFNIIFTSGLGPSYVERDYKEHMKSIKEVLSNVLKTEKTIKIVFEMTRAIEPSGKHKFEMLEERLDRIEELLMKKII